MYRLIIVDDDEIIREGLVNCVDWKTLGFEVVGAFEDGKDAIEWLSANPVDAVFTDVQMFQVSGVELAKYIYRNHPHVKVVEISGYKEFQYIRESMSYDVCDYILKPVDAKEVEQVFTRVREKLDKEEKERENRQFQFSFYETEEYTGLIQVTRQLIDNVWQGDRETLQKNLHNLERRVQQFPQYGIYTTVVRLLEQLYQELPGKGIRPSGRLSYTVVLKELDGLQEEMLFEKVEEILCRFVHFLENQRKSSLKNPIEKAKEYIEGHYRENLSVSQIGAIVFLNPNYLSREFKRIVGMNLTDYITKVRMEAAIQCMRAGKHNAGEIGFLAGYENTRYFHKVFKEYTGYTVKQYQKILAENEKER